MTKHEFMNQSDIEDTMVLEDMLEEGTELVIIDISPIYKDVTSKVVDHVDYLMSLCVPSIELDLASMEEEGTFEHYGVTYEEFERHQHYVTQQLYKIGGYQYVYHNQPYKLLGTMLYILVNT